MKEHSPPADAVWRWRKSSYSEASGNSDCVELGWRKSSYTEPNGMCVEVAPALDAVRDSKDPAGPVLTVPGLPALLTHLKGGRLGY